jgi:hypothetical protein
MNKKTNKEDSNDISPVPIPSKRITKNSFSILIVIVALIVIGGIYFYPDYLKTNESLVPSEEEGSNLVDDLIFSQGFIDTGQEWPPKGAHWSQELKQNPLVKLKEEYCNRVGYKYADFAGECFVFQYFDSFNTYSDSEERFTVYYPNLWQEDLENSNYEFTTNPKISLKRQGATCALVYGFVDESEISSLSNASTTKVSFGRKASGSVDSGTEGLNKITLSFEKELTDEEKAAGYTNSKLITIPHFPYPYSEFGFLLTSGDNQPLVEACVKEFDTILNSRAINYPSSNLSNQSNGALSIQDVSSWFESYAHIPQKITLLFENYVTGKEESIVPEAFSNTRRIYDPFLSGEKLFYIESVENSPVIKSVDIFTGQNKIIPLAYDTTKTIHSFFVKDNVLYYIMGGFCNEYLTKCKDMSLKSYNLISGVSEILTNISKSRDIDGFDASGDTLILRWSDGDAGCSWGLYEAYTFSNQILKDVGSYSRCEGDTNDSRAEFKSLVVGSGSFKYLVVKNGNIFSPNVTDSYQEGVYIRVNTTEYPFGN